MNPLQIGTHAPDFSLQDQNGNLIRLSDIKNSWILLYFYPKDNTPGCTAQACGLRDASTAYESSNIRIIGVSKDSVKSHKKFETDHSLTFTLLADTNTEVAKLYGVWGPKKFMGREFLGMHRISFLIDPEGIIRKTYEKVDVLKHASQILADHNELTNQSAA
jgi:thioredoxin-dependent peroxiredoxin